MRATDQSGHDLGDENSVAKAILSVRFLRSVALRLLQAVAKRNGTGHDLGDEHSVAKANPAKNPQRPFGRVHVSMGDRSFIKREQVVTF